MRIPIKQILLEQQTPKNLKEIKILDTNLKKDNEGEVNYNESKKLFEILVDDEHKYFIDKNGYILFEYPKYKIKNFVNKHKHDSQDRSNIKPTDRLKLEEFYNWYFN